MVTGKEKKKEILNSTRIFLLLMTGETETIWPVKWGG